MSFLFNLLCIKFFFLTCVCGMFPIRFWYDSKWTIKLTFSDGQDCRALWVLNLIKKTHYKQWHPPNTLLLEYLIVPIKKCWCKINFFAIKMKGNLPADCSQVLSMFVWQSKPWTIGEPDTWELHLAVAQCPFVSPTVTP